MIAELPVPSMRPPLPEHFYVDIGNVCNLRCPFCATGSGTSTQPRGLMSLDKFHIILNKIAGSAKLISLYNWGEPTLNKDLFAMARACRARRIRTHIDTNLSALRFTRETAEQLVDSGLSSLFISVDGITQGVYEQYRVRGKLDLVWANLKLILAAKERLQSPTPEIGWNFHVHRGNEHEMDAARALANYIGIPIAFKRMSVPLESWKSSYHDNDDMFLDSDNRVQEIYSPPQDPSFNRDLFHGDLLHPCFQMFQGTMTIDWNGDVYPCTVVEGAKSKMGNLLTGSLEDMWWGVEFLKSRDFIIGFGPKRSCGSVCEKIDCAMKTKHAHEAS